MRSLSLASEQLLAALPLAALVVNDAGDILLANRAAASLLECAEDALVGQALRQHLPAGVKLRDEQTRERAIAVTASGAFLPVLVSTTPVEKECLQLVLIEPVQPETDTSYQRAFRAAASGIAFVSRSGHFLEMNPSFCQITGYSEEELLRMTANDLSEPEDRCVECAGIERLASGEIPSLRVEKRFRRRDGRTIWVNLEIALVALEDDHLGYFIAEVTDITQRKAAERRTAAFHEATHAIESRPSFDEALREALGHLASAAGWSACEYWEPGENGPRRRVVWSADPEGAAAPAPAEVVSRAFREPAPPVDSPDGKEGNAPPWVVLPLIDHGAPFAVLVGRGGDGALDPAFVAMVDDFARLLGQVLERRRAEQALQLLGHAIEATADGVLILDATQPELPVLSANPAACRITGYALDELVGRSIAFLRGEHGDAPAARAMRKAVQHGHDAHALTRHRRRDGAVSWINLTVSPIRDERGHVRQVIAVLHDITDRVESEHQLRESQTLLAEAQSIARIGSVDYDLRTHRLNATAETWRLLGLEDATEEERTRLAYERIDHVAFRTAVERAATSGETVTIDQRVAIPGRYVRDVRFVLRSVADDAGRPVRVRGTMMDITEMRLAEQALRESEALQRSVVANLAEGVIVYEEGGACRICNASAQQITGLNAEQLAGRAPLPEGWRVIREDGSPFPLAELPAHQALRTGERQVGVVIGFVRPNGETTWCEASAQPLVRPGATKPHRVVFSLRDITESRRAAAELLAANEQLTRQVAALQQRTREITLLSEMGELLSSCQATEDAYVIISELGGSLFPGSSGMLALIDDGGQAELLSAWGDHAISREFAPGDCWALRRSRPHLVQNTRSGLVCAHLRDRPPAAYLCIPLVAQGEVFGVLHLGQTTDAIGEDRQQLAVTVAEHVALALSNLRLRESLRNQSVRDPLTDLFNRRYLEEALRLEERRAARSERGLALMMIDIDHFKSFNDHFGHDAGDLVLREFGRLLRSHIRGGDIACRFGGEEFTLILPEIGAADAYARAEHIRTAVAEMRLVVRGHPLGTLTCSIGVAVFPDHASTIDECLTAADRALYRAKALGRNCTVLAGE